MTEIKIVVAFKGGMTRKGQERTFWDVKNILYLDFDADYMGVNICQILRFGHVTVYNLLFQKRKLGSYYFFLIIPF